MLKLSCPLCSRIYHADEEHIGKNIRCTKCGDIIPIVWQDGRYDGSRRPLQTVEGKKASVAPPNVGSVVSPHSGNASDKRRWLAAAKLCLVVLLLGLVCLLFVGFRQERAFDLSDLGGRQIEPRKSSSDPPKRDDKPAPPVTLDPSTAVGVDDKPLSREPVALQPGDFEEAPASTPSRPTNSYGVPLKAGPDPELRPKTHPMPNGAQIIPDAATNGHGEIEAFNGTEYDAYLVVVDAESNTPVRQRFIYWGQSVTLNHLSPGEYRVVFATGSHWNEAVREFESDNDYFRMGRNLSLRETSDSRALHYERHSITLNPVPNGNVPVVHLTKAEFRALSGDGGSQ